MLRSPSVASRLLLVPLFGTALAGPLRAGDPIFDAKGFNPNREFVSQLPFEHVDPMTGNLLLTFTDLELPGNAGFNLRIQRTYNSKIYESYSNLGSYTLIGRSWAGLGWTLHLGRVHDANPGPSEPGPVIEMPDGSRHQAYRHLDGNANHFITRDWWTYERALPAPVLRLPNGLKYTFGHVIDADAGNEQLGVTRIEDRFGNVVTIEYAPPPAPQDVIARIVQSLGPSSRTREITFTYDPTLPNDDGDPVAAGSLRTMEFDGRTWTYVQKARGVYLTLLTEVRPPLGPSWQLRYREDPAFGDPAPWILKGLTTPAGGQLDYVYRPQLFYVGSGVIYTPSLETRTATGPGIAPGSWSYAYSSTSWTQPVVSSVTSLCGTVTRYTFKAIGPAGSEQPWAIGAMARKEVLDGAGAVVERSDLEWARSMPVSDFPESGSSFRTHVALLKSRTVVRAGSSQTYATVNTYDERPYRADRASNFNDFGRPKEALETGELTRRTSRTFFYGTGADPSFTTFIADKTASETVEVGGESFTSSWKYEAATGFTKSQTINGITTTFSRDDYGNVASATDANGNKTRYTYEWGVVKDTLRPEYDITREINRDGTVKSETRRGFKTGFEYDQLSRLILTDPPLGNSVVTEYDNATGRLTRVTRGPSVLTSETNGFGQPIKTANSLRVTTVTTYDACGRPVYQSYPFYEEGPTPNIGPRPSTTRWAAPPGASIPTARSCASSTPA